MNKIRIGVIPAAGKGNRISPLSKILPKPMITILDRPILEFVVKRMVYEFGIEEIYMIVGYMQDMIKGYFKNGEELGVKINYIEQKEPKGIAHAISLTEPYIKEPFLVVLGDDFTLGSIKNLGNTFFEKKAWVVQAVTKDDDIDSIKRTGCAVLDRDGKYLQVIEKPMNPVSNTRICGIYAFDPIIFKYIKKTHKTPPRNEIEITTSIGMAAKEGKAYGEFIRGTNININTKEELLLANLLLARILEKQKKIEMEKIYRFLNKKYNRENNGFFKKIGMLK